ncbi:hypothetical protein B0G80_2293 [Paraburkholderia sp. BL6669N2]|nr:hypothetical protein B0G80_2293 [Paraburkholderia sp. BL6669N2]
MGGWLVWAGGERVRRWVSARRLCSRAVLACVLAGSAVLACGSSWRRAVGLAYLRGRLSACSRAIHVCHAGLRARGTCAAAQALLHLRVTHKHELRACSRATLVGHAPARGETPPSKTPTYRRKKSARRRFFWSFADWLWPLTLPMPRCKRHSEAFTDRHPALRPSTAHPRDDLPVHAIPCPA